MNVPSRNRVSFVDVEMALKTALFFANIVIETTEYCL
jgi:hypothetical protein